ncbi:MAG: LPS export ABC transporter permease LptG [Proteobacteria bacterium]|nr:LPS export ABC transporter permease LptG [Pseudomonadota bacterium]
MRISATLSLYIGRHFLLGFLAVFAGFLFLIYIFDTVELMRRAVLRPDIPMSAIVEMAFFKLPHMGQQAFPFAALCGATLVFWRLTRSHELVVTRAAGISAWQFLLPVLVVAFLLGAVRVAITNPFASTMLARFERLEANLFHGQYSALAISENGLWLRQAGAEGPSVIYASSIVQQANAVELGSVTVFLYAGKDRFNGRISAHRAALEDGFWHLYDVWVYEPELPARHEREMWLETDLTLNRIQESFASPETMSFWALPAFIKTLEQAGFSALRHRLHLHSLLAAPALMCAMVLIAATFTLRDARRGGTIFVVTAGLLSGFLLYFMSDVVYALGLSDSIPPTLAAWAPSGIATLLGVSMLFHLEDG